MKVIHLTYLPSHKYVKRLSTFTYYQLTQVVVFSNIFDLLTRMKRPFLLLFLLITSTYIALAQSTISETEKLAATAKVWGFLKYYHPQVADGEFDWDKQLFEIIPEVRKATNKDELSQVFTGWINALGTVEVCKKCSKQDQYSDKNFDLQWINNSSLFTDELSKTLRYIELNRHLGKKQYVGSKNQREVIIKNEADHEELDWTSENLRLLTLFRYWNIIEYFFPYKYQTDTPWDEVLSQMIPKFLTSNSETDFHLAMLELIVSIDDSHGFFGTDVVNDFFGKKWIPAQFEIVENKPIITDFYNDSLALANDLRIGDIITKVDGKSIEELFNAYEKYIYGSNASRKRYLSKYRIFNGSTDSVTIEFKRGTETSSKTIGRYPFKAFKYKKPKVEKSKILNGNIGYVDMGLIEKKDVSKIMDEFMDTKAIIFDIRNYPRGTLYEIIKYISSKRSDFYKVLYPDINYPGKFLWRDGQQCGKGDELKYLGKVILLVNEKSQSHAEFTAMCLQTGDHVTTIGSQTSGADGNVSRFKMVGGFKTAMSGIGIFYPDGTETQRKGVKVDIEVTPTVQGVLAGKDEVLEKAIDFINQE